MSPTDKISGKIISQFAKQMQKQGLYTAGCGGGESGGKINLVDVCFDTHQVMNIESARKLIVESSNALLTLINSNDSYAECFIQNPVPIELIRISIIGEFLITNCDYVSSVSVVQGKVCYKKNDPSLKIKSHLCLHRETFEEAVQILAQQKTCDDDVKPITSRADVETL